MAGTSSRQYRRRLRKRPAVRLPCCLPFPICVCYLGPIGKLWPFVRSGLTSILCGVMCCRAGYADPAGCVGHRTHRRRSVPVGCFAYLFRGFRDLRSTALRCSRCVCLACWLATDCFGAVAVMVPSFSCWLRALKLHRAHYSFLPESCRGGGSGQAAPEAAATARRRGRRGIVLVCRFPIEIAMFFVVCLLVCRLPFPMKPFPVSTSAFPPLLSA